MARGIYLVGWTNAFRAVSGAFSLIRRSPSYYSCLLGMGRKRKEPTNRHIDYDTLSMSSSWRRARNGC